MAEKLSAAVHMAATTGFDDAAAYDAHRPSYPARAVDGLLGSLGLTAPPARVVDLAAGTGKFTELLAAAGGGGGGRFEVLAVEPVAKMRDTLAAKRLPGVTVCEGLATKMDVPNGWADAVIAAQVRRHLQPNPPSRVCMRPLPFPRLRR